MVQQIPDNFVNRQIEVLAARKNGSLYYRTNQLITLNLNDVPQYASQVSLKIFTEDIDFVGSYEVGFKVSLLEDE